MRKPTKEALDYLAKTMVESGHYITLRGTAKFIEWALRLHKTTGSYVTAQTIRAHEKELEEMCQAEMLNRYPIKKDIEVPKQFDDDVFDSDFDDEDEDDANITLYDEYGMIVDDSSLISIVFAKIEKMMSERQKAMIAEVEAENRIDAVKSTSAVKDYSMFFEDEDGLRVKRGEYKGLYVHEIDAQRWTGCAIGWSRYQLKQNEDLGADRPGALTEDDKNVFLDIISGKDV